MRFDGFRVLATDADLLSLIQIMSVKIVPLFLVKAHNEYLGRSRDSTPHAQRSRRDCGHRLFSLQNKTISTFSPDGKIVKAFDLNFCKSKATNVGNNMSKVQSFPSITVGIISD